MGVDKSPSHSSCITVILDVGGTPQEVANDFVWIFAGGNPPNAFLKKIGVSLGARDMTGEASAEAMQAGAGQRLAATVSAR